MTARRLVSIGGALAAAACAAVGEGAPRAPVLNDVRTIASVRVLDARSATRAKDPLDALGESLEARGYEVRAVEVGRRPRDELRGIERLHARLGARIAAAPRAGARGRAAALGAEAGRAVAALGVDAVALHHRFDERTLFAPADPRAQGTLLPPAPVAGRPRGAVSLVDRSGNAIWSEWGAPLSEADPDAPINAAEAIEVLLRALAGTPAGA
jgi:hypothetical protein